MQFRSIVAALCGFVTENVGAVIDALATLALLLVLHRFPRGRGQPVLLVPGLFSSDFFLKPLAWFLRKLGYRVETWGAGMNLARHTAHMCVVVGKVRALYRETGIPVVVIGHSLGGLYALCAAHACGAKRVRSVITLGAPIYLDISRVAKWIRVLLPKFSGLTLEEHVRNPLLARVRKLPHKIPVTTIAAAYDAVVGTKVCSFEGTHPHYIHAQVVGTHNSLVVGVGSFMVIFERAACSTANWQPFDTRRSGRLARLVQVRPH